MKNAILIFAMLVFCCGYAHSTVRAVVIAGLGGEPPYTEEFETQARSIADQLSATADELTLLTGDDASTAAIARTLSGWAERSVPDDRLIVVYIGHGSYDEEHYRFNLPGPDPTGDTFSSWLNAYRGKRQLVIASGSSSGALHDFLASDDRTVMTATRGGGQRNATIFGEFLTSALTVESADTDKDRSIGAEEAFAYASSRVTSYYDRRQEMATENPTRSGPVSTLTLASLNPLPDPGAEHAPLYAHREAIERDIEALKATRADFAANDYFEELQRLLLDLAVVQSQIEAIETPEGEQ
jgi:hypothetical protein